MSDIVQAMQAVGGMVWVRFIDLLLAPARNPEMLWSAIPLLIATFFIIIYFGRNRKEELGWNTAFGNTMVFIFTAINIIRQMYYQGGTGSWENLLGNEFYVFVSLALIGCGVAMMIVTYAHLLPKRFAFFLFSAPPINVAAYVVMAIIYSSVPADWVTALATVVFLALILIFGWLIQLVMKSLGEEEKGGESTRVEELADKVEAELEARRKARLKSRQNRLSPDKV